jgi:protein translocase SecG subunit
LYAFHVLLNVVQVLLGISLIFIVAIQQTKNEGLGGSIGGRVQTSFKGKAGFEERLNDLTKNLGIGFFVISILVAVTYNRW